MYLYIFSIYGFRNAFRFDRGRRISTLETIKKTLLYINMLHYFMKTTVNFHQSLMLQSIPDENLNNVVVGVMSIAPRPNVTSNPTASNFTECGRISGTVGSAETANVTCLPGGVIGRHLVVMINDAAARLCACEITADGEGRYIYER